LVPKQKNERTVILKADDQTIILTLGRDGKFQARTSSWEDPKVFRDGDGLESALQHGRWVLPISPAIRLRRLGRRRRPSTTSPAE
jgi:hypothetical protein